MKITKVPKRLAEALPQVQDLLRRVLNARDEELPDILDGIIDWCWPRGDLHFWVPVLNRFDRILEETCRDYELHKLQINEFTPVRKRIVISVLHFTRLLIENSTSRKLYNSYEHLNSLLLARDIDVLEGALRLLMRFAQQQSNQQPRPELAAAQQRLAALAVAWPPRELRISNVDLAKEDATVHSSLKHVRFQVYTAASSSSAPEASGSASTSADDPQPQTPSRPRVPTRALSGPLSTPQNAGSASAQNTPSATQPLQQHDDGVKNVDLGKLDGSSKHAMDILADAIEEHSIPKEDHLELFQRIRLAVNADKPKERRQLLVCRLLALASYAHVTSETLASSQLFLFEPDVVQSTAELVKPEHELDQHVVSSALYALDALGRYRSKLTEVLSSLSASVNHGVLMQVLRNIIDDLATGDPKRTDLIIDAFYGLSSFITSTSSGSSLIVGAGLVQLLVRLLEQANPQEYIVQRTMTRTLGLLDSLVYAYPPAFELFCQARGLEVIVQRIEEQIQHDIDNASTRMQEEGAEGPDAPYGKLTYGRAHLLRGLLQSILHMMVSTGTADGLRNLIDTSIIASIKNIMENRRVFGPQNLALAINLMATFVHNEPTTLGVIQEKKLPETFLQLVKNDIEAHFDVISAIPNAVGALCLNQAGLDMFSSEPILAKLLGLLTSERHIKVLSDQDNISVFGGTIDELIRHQPTLRQSLMDELLKIIKTIHTLGNDYKAPETTDVALYSLSEVSPEALAQQQAEKPALQVTAADLLTDDLDVKKQWRAGRARANNVTKMIDTLSHFLETLFQSSQVCKDFLKTDGLELLLKFYELPCIPFNFTTLPAADSFVHLLQFISEASPNMVVHAILRQVHASFMETEYLWHTSDAERLLTLAAPQSAEIEQKNAAYRSLIRLCARVQLFSDVAASFYFTQSKTMLAFLQVFSSERTSHASGSEHATLADFASFQRYITMLSIHFKRQTPTLPNEDKEGKGDDDNALRRTPSEELNADAEAAALRDVPMNESGIAGLDPGNDDGASNKVREPLTRNLIALRCILGQMRQAVSSLFADTVRLLNAKRISDTSHKRAANTTATQIGEHLAKFQELSPSDMPHGLAYYEYATREAMRLMYEDRTGRSTSAQVMILPAFVRNAKEHVTGNLQSLIEHIGKTYFDEQGKPLTSDDLQTTMAMSVSCSAMRASLKFCLSLISSKASIDSSIPSVAPKDAERYQMLMDLRQAILPVVWLAWEQPWLRELPVSNLRYMIQIFVRFSEEQVEEAKKKDSPPQPSQPAGGSSLSSIRPLASDPHTGLAGALSGLTNALNPAMGLGGMRSRAAPVPANENRINQLVDMGFSRRAAAQALANNLNNVSAATEFLLSHPEIANAPDDAPEEATQETGASGSSGEAAQGEAAGDAASQTTDSSAPNQSAGITDDQSGRDGNDESAPDVPPRENEAEGASSAPANAENEESTDVSMGEAATSTNESAASETTTESAAYKEGQKRMEEWRTKILETLVPKSLVLADRHESLIYEVKNALFVASDGFKNSELLVGMIKEIEAASAASLDEVEGTVNNRLHLLALTLNDSTVTVELSAERAKQLMVAVRSLLDAHMSDERSDRTPRWTASLLLVLAAVLRADYHVPSIELPGKDAPDGKDDATGPISSSSLFVDDTPVLLQFTLKRLQNLQGLSADDLLAFYRFIVILTQRAKPAKEFLEKDGLTLMLRPFLDIEAKDIESCRPHAVLVMRNVIEASPGILYQMMEAALMRHFKEKRTKTVDTTSLSRALMGEQLRDPDLFLEVAKEKLQMIDYSTSKSQGFVKLRENADEASQKSKPQNKDSESQPSRETQASGTAEAPVEQSETSKGDTTDVESVPDEVMPVMHFLISETQRCSRDVFAKRADANAAAERSEDMEVEKAGSSDAEEGKARDKKFFYVSFLLQSLAELVSSYPSCKTAFLQYSKRRGSTATAAAQRKETPSKNKSPSSALSTFLGDLVPLGFIMDRPEEEMRRALSLSNWAMSTVVGLCADAASHDVGLVECTNARRNVAEALVRCFKDATGTGAGRSYKEASSIRYGRLYALSELCSRLFTANPNRGSLSGGAKAHDSNVQIVKILLERNFVGVLSAAIADIDLNVPTAKALIERILKPLGHLTKLANMMNKAERKADGGKLKPRTSSQLSHGDSSESASDETMSEDEDGRDPVDADLREETPDFYRNSSLGMHTGDLEAGDDSFDEDEDEDEDEEEDDEMEDDMHGPMGYDDNMTSDDSGSDDDDDIEEHIVEIMDERGGSDDESSDGSESDSDDDDEEEEGSWVDEDDDGEDEGLGDEGQPLDLILEEGADGGVFGGDAPMFPGDDGIYDDGSMPAPIFVDGDPDDDEEGDDMDDEEGESILEEAFEEEPSRVTMTLPGESMQQGPTDRFGANWSWASRDPTAHRPNVAGDAAGENVSPFAFLRQTPAVSRHQRMVRRLMDWDGDFRTRDLGPPGSSLVSGIGASGRTQANRDVAAHPLLTAGRIADAEGPSAVESVRAPRAHHGRHHHHRHQHGGEGRDWARSIEELMSGGAMQLLESLMNRGRAGQTAANGQPQPIQISLTSENGMPRMALTGAPGMMQSAADDLQSARPGPRSQQDGPQARGEGQSPSASSETDLVTLVQQFLSRETCVRWGEVMRIVHGPLVEHRLNNMRNHIICGLRPDYLVRQEEQKKKRAELEEEKRKNKQEIEQAQREKQRVEEELQQARQQFEEARTSREEGERAAESGQESASSVAQEGQPGEAAPGEDTVMSEEASTQPSQNTPASTAQADLELGSLQQGLAELDRSAQAGNSSAAQANGQAPSTAHEASRRGDAEQEASTGAQQPRERVTTVINGSEVDITDSGIDPTFLEALPEDMREEVLNQHFRERRAAQAARSAGNAMETSNIAPEFLDALPPEIRAEVMQQEALEQQRRRMVDRQRRGEGEEADGAARDMDSADFLATLHPELRNAILQDGDPSFLESLPSGVHDDIDAAQRMMARRRAARDQERSARARADAPTNGGQGSSTSRSATAHGATSAKAADDKKQAGRDAIQLLDKSGVAALVRLMFLPQLDVQQSGLRDVLANLSENGKTRTEILNILLLLLAENTGADGGASDRGIAALTQHASKAVQNNTRPGPKRSATASSGMTAQDTQRKSSVAVAPLSRRTGDDAPFLVALRSIDMLLHLTSTHEQAANHFLRDDASSGALCRWLARTCGMPSSKGKERTASAGSTTAPVNILLALLSKRSILDNPQLVDGLIALLNTVTRGLPTIAANASKAANAAKEGANGQQEIKEASDGAATSNGATSQTQAPSADANGRSESNGKDKESSLPTTMPQIVDERVAAIVKPLSTSISSKGFQHTLAVASHLAAIDGAQDVIAEALRHEASAASQNLLGELDALLESLPEPAEPADEDTEQPDGQAEDVSGERTTLSSESGAMANGARPASSAMPSVRINSPALTELASPSSSQTVILRSLRALDWVLTRPNKNASATIASNTAPAASTTAARMPAFGIPQIVGGRFRFSVQ